MSIGILHAGAMVKVICWLCSVIITMAVWILNARLLESSASEGRNVWPLEAQSLPGPR